MKIFTQNEKLEVQEYLPCFSLWMFVMLCWRADAKFMFTIFCHCIGSNKRPKLHRCWN